METVQVVCTLWLLLRCQSLFAGSVCQGAYAAAHRQAAHRQAAHRQAAQHPVAQHQAAHRVPQAVQDTSSNASTITGTKTMQWI